MGFNTMFNLAGIIFPITFILFAVVFITVFVKGIGTWNKNNHSPRLTVEASVIAKRTDISRSHHSHNSVNDFHSRSSSSYYVTFQFESGDRMEFSVTGQDYGMLIEGDRGRLSFQGTRYLGFERR